MYKLLVADDEEKLLTGLCSYYPWGDLGFQIAARVRNGKEALEYMERYSVDVVLTDISMPVMDGIQLAEQVRKRWPEVMVIFLSGYADFKYAQKAISYGVKEYILKPVKMEELKQVFTVVRKALDFRGEDSGEDLGYYDNVIDRVNHYIGNHMADANLEQAAKLVNLNANYLSTLYKQRTKRTFSEELLRVRMEAARRQLSKPEYRIYQIAEALGYENARNFSRAFKNYFGYSPREQRMGGMERTGDEKAKGCEI